MSVISVTVVVISVTVAVIAQNKIKARLTVIPARVGQKMRVLAADYKIDFLNKVDKFK